jgi:hypothetical protein
MQRRNLVRAGLWVIAGTLVIGYIAILVASRY